MRSFKEVVLAIPGGLLAILDRNRRIAVRILMAEFRITVKARYNGDPFRSFISPQVSL